MKTGKEFAKELIAIVHEAESQLRSKGTPSAAVRTEEGKWSKMEIVGHLCDSAVNNLPRFVEVQMGRTREFALYDQDEWVDIQNYNDFEWKRLLEHWHTFNMHIAFVVARIDDEKMSNVVTNGAELVFNKTEQPVTLHHLITDYIEHLKHHIKTLN